VESGAFESSLTSLFAFFPLRRRGVWVPVAGFMETITPARLLDALNWRYATKQFDPAKKIPSATWEALEDTLVLSASSFGLQPWRFFVVDSPAKREELVPVSWGQRQVADASHAVVFALKSPLSAADVAEHTSRTAEVRGVPRESLAGMEKMIAGFLENPPYPLELRAWAARQVYLALGNFMTSAALLGIDTCPMEGIDPASYDRILGIENSGFFTVAACAAGYRHPDDKYAALAKVRFPKSTVLHHIQ